MAAERKPERSSTRGDRVVRLARDLAAVLSESGLSEIEVADGDLRLRVQRAAVTPVATPIAPPSTPDAASVERPVVIDVAAAGTVTLEAPMVGTFYRAPSPTSDPYVKEGDVVKEGQVLCIIEAMKLMNEIESKVAGRVAKILVENGQPVEFGQPLFLIEPQR